MAEPTWLNLVPIEEVTTREHQPTRGCWCGPTFAIDIRSTLGRDDVRVLLHRSSMNPARDDEFVALRARKGEFVTL